MGLADSTMNPYLADPHRFAEVINQSIFHGRKVIHPEKLKDLDSTSNMAVAPQNRRDIVKQYDNGTILIIVGIENQTNIHYAMPLRGLGYDYRSYERQRRKIAKQHKEKKDLTGDEFLSQFAKTDKLTPVITLVVYYGLNWDGPRELHDILEIPEELENYKSLIANYQMNLLEVTKIQNLDSYDDDLKLVFGFIKYQYDKKEMFHFLNKNKEVFQNASQETKNVIEAVTGSKKIREYMKKNEEEENMGTAFLEILDDCRQEGRLAEREEMILEFLRDHGEISQELKDKVAAQKNLETLKCWVKISARVKSIEEFVEKTNLL